MTQTGYGVLIGFILGGGVLLLLGSWVAEGQKHYDATAVGPNVTNYFEINTTLRQSSDQYDSLKSSPSQTASSLNLLKNTPSVVKKNLDTVGQNFDGMIRLTNDIGVPQWVLATLATLFVVVILFILLRAALGSTP